MTLTSVGELGTSAVHNRTRRPHCRPTLRPSGLVELQGLGLFDLGSPEDAAELSRCVLYESPAFSQHSLLRLLQLACLSLSINGVHTSRN